MIEKIFEKNGQFGVIIKGEDGAIYTYWHIDPTGDLYGGQLVTIGTPIGAVKKRDGAHLHYARHRPPFGNWELRADDNAIDPLRQLKFGDRS